MLSNAGMITWVLLIHLPASSVLESIIHIVVTPGQGIQCCVKVFWGQIILTTNAAALSCQKIFDHHRVLLCCSAFPDLGNQGMF